MPAEIEKGSFIAKIACLVSLDLCRPPFGASAWYPCDPAVLMPMPEAAVDEDDGAVFRQDEIGFAGEGFVARTVDREAVAEPVEHRTQGQFGFRVPTADTRHDLRAFF